ncbi:hypothetical protein EV646_112189 [Kribbella antiqua]|uniref:Acetyltransferase (GNAT) family protein n=1 Tax=Kribbella antiqua TaxID=2512217 RepID=A0A4R2IH83_9ACTN|nr:hypothetical protein EV646_112189 [Kribbella antiqua]
MSTGCTDVDIFGSIHKDNSNSKRMCEAEGFALLCPDGEEYDLYLRQVSFDA